MISKVRCLIRTTWMPLTDFSHSPEPFIPDQPDKLMAEGAFSKDINVIIGRTEDEGIIYLLGRPSIIFSSNKYFFSQMFWETQRPGTALGRTLTGLAPSLCS